MIPAQRVARILSDPAQRRGLVATALMLAGMFTLEAAMQLAQPLFLPLAGLLIAAGVRHAQHR